KTWRARSAANSSANGAACSRASGRNSRRSASERPPATSLRLGLMKSNKATVKVLRPAVGKNVAPLVREILGAIGEDPLREGLVRTPERVDQALKFLTSGYRTNVQEVLNGALYEVKYDEMVVVKDIEFFSMCEHHMLPFFGKVHVAYLP